MNILVITKAAWDDRLASGNTLSNFFEGWEKDNFFCLYSRNAMPNNKVCNEYLSISPFAIVKNIFRPSKIGSRFFYNNESYQDDDSELKMIAVAKQNKTIFQLIYHLLYSTNLWKNNSFKKFIKDSNPDIVFCFGQTDPLTCKALKYVKQHTKAKIISYFVDDLYKNEFSFVNVLQRLKNEYLMEISEMSDLRYAISQRMCDEYNELYRKPFHLLHKGCDISEPKAHVNKPIKFVYAGNLFYNRDSILCALASAISKVNEGIPKAYLDIYSSTQVDNIIFSKLNIKGASTLHKARPFDEIKQIMRDADIVLHVESFNKEQMKLVRLSFSTKITDCMQSGSMMMAIGPNTIASIDYATHVPGCIVINNLENLENTIKVLVNHHSVILENAAKTNKYAKENIEIYSLRNRMRSEFTRLINKRQ